MSNKSFQHISQNNSFPGLSEEIKYKNEFDYTKWDKQTKIRLMNVKWNGNNSNVVYFENEEKRDEFFDNQVAEEIVLETMQELLPNGEIKLPFTFGSANRFNYMEVIYPQMPVEEEYSFSRKRYYYFIESINQLAPSATEFFLKLDAWTTFIYSCDINYMVLNRGHAPLINSPLQKYLDDPISNSKYLLAEDYNVDNNDIIPFQKLETLNDKDMYVCFAIKGDIKGTWGIEKEDSWQIPQKSSWVNEGVPTNLCMYAVASQDYNAFMNYVYQNITQWYRTLEAIFVLPGKLLSLKNSFSFGNITCYELDANQTHIMDFKLKKEDFNFPEEYSELTKLYTFPYSYLEITNEQGQKHTVKIENTTNNIEAYSTLNIAYPFLKLDVMFNGIGSAKDASTQFMNLDQRTFVYGGKWADYLLEYDIPTYAVNPNVYSEWELDNYWDIQDLLMTAEVVYLNECDYARMTNGNEIRSANTDKVNSDNEGNNVYNNAVLRANNIINNNSASVLSALTQLNNGITYQNNMREDLNNKQELDFDAAETVTEFTTNNEQAAEWASAVTGAIGSIGGSAAAGAAAGSIAGPEGTAAGAFLGMGLAAPQAAMDLVNTAFQTYLTGDNATIVIQGSRHQTSNSQGFNSISTEFSNVLATANTNAQVNCMSTQASNSSTTEQGVGSNTSSTIKTNASNTQSTRTNNSNSKLTTVLNNAKRTYDLALRKAHFRDESGQIEKPTTYGAYSGSDTNATKPMSIQYNLITKSQSAIKEIGDIFCRYGYMLNQNWDFKTFNLMRYFTYWKVDDIWLLGKDKYMNERHRNDIINILKNGTTVWKDPNKIGGVSIYENI